MNNDVVELTVHSLSSYWCHCGVTIDSSVRVLAVELSLFMLLDQHGVLPAIGIVLSQCSGAHEGFGATTVLHEIVVI